MKVPENYRRATCCLTLCSLAALSLSICAAPAAFAAVPAMNNYCDIPPFIAQTVPPLTMLVVGKDQNLFHQAYSDAADLDGDGKLDIEYTHTIDYYGYFDSNKCYTYASGLFTPANVTTDKFCTSTQWSGNVLNWLTMSRMDVLRKVLYGGHRSSDPTSGATVLQRAYIPMDAHSWGKELTGRLCKSGSTYTHSCSLDRDCDSGYTCTDIAAQSKYLVPFAAATPPTTCTAAAVTSNNAGNLLVARYQHNSSKSCDIKTSSDLINSYEPQNLFNPNSVALGTGLVKYVTGFDSSTLWNQNYADNYNILVTTNFTPDVSGTWQFAVDGDDDVEVQVGNTVVAQYLGCHGAAGDYSHNGSINLTAGTTYAIVARHFEAGGSEGIRVWFKRPPIVGGTVLTDYITTLSDGTTKTAYTATCSATNTGGTSNGGTRTGGTSGSGGTCTVGNPCTCTPNTPSGYTKSQSGNTLTFTPTAPTNATCTGSPTLTCTPNNWAYVSSSSTTTGASSGLYAPLTLSAPVIASGNECALEDPSFIASGTPVVGKTITSGTAHQHLFCNTTLSDDGTPILRLMKDMPNRVWDWSAKERPECNDSTHGSNYPFSTNPTDYSVKVSVCNSGLLESNCKAYGSGASTVNKPTGLLQKYGEGDGSKVCSKTYSVACTSDSDCGASAGKCIYKAPMYFGMIGGSYKNNLNGGVLRKNIGSILDEITQSNGTFITTTEGIIQNFEDIKPEGYSYSSYSYEASSNGEVCGWLETAPLANGQCQNWGNPIAEMMYESLRYFSGKGTATPAFTYSGTTNNDSTLGLSNSSWGFTKGTNTLQPYDVYPLCSHPFMLVLSDVNPSYDGDKVPGSTYADTGLTEDAAAPTLGLGGLTGGVTKLNSLVDIIGTGEGIAGHSWYIGQSGSTYDNLCTTKAVTNLSTVRGLCPLEPTKQGTYYSSALAYFGENGFKAATGLPAINTYAVAISPPFADLKIKAGSGFITLVPTGKSVSGGASVYESCAAKCTLAYSGANSGFGLTITNCSSDAFCPTNQVVNFFVDDIRYDSSNNVIYSVFRINYEDSEQGADYDMDAIIKYEVCTQAAQTAGYGSCNLNTTPLGSNIQINLWTEYGAGGIDQVLGFTISGTTADGVYLPVKDGDVSDTATGTTPAVVATMPETWSRIFTPNNTPSDFIKNPLWYAAKWGGFTDSNNSKTPDLRTEWAKNCTAADEADCDPDNYFLVTNPLKLETQLDSALNSILARVSSGTASSILNNTQGSGANLIQAVFYPQKIFDDNSSANWIGEMQNLWYYLDPFFNSSTVRIDSNSDYSLDLTSDYIAHFRFDSAQNQTVVDLSQDVNGNGLSLVGKGTYNSDDPNVKSLWRAGKLLWQRNLTTDPRKIYTVTSPSAGSTLASFVNDGTFNAQSGVQTLLQAASSTEAGTIIDYTLGTDQTGYRSRKVNILGCGLTDSQGCVREWKLGDIINSTPKLESNSKLQSYDQQPPNGYGDSSYASYAASTDYRHRGMAFVGANDGMLHAFKLGILDVSGQTSTHKATMRNPDGSAATSASKLGREQWAFIPYNALPYLRYLGDTAYNHLFSVDLTTTLVDASIHVPTDNNNTTYPNCATGTYWNCGRKTITDGSGNLDFDKSSWRTILIGGMGLGGASQNSNSTCTDLVSTGTCVKAPVSGVGYSSYFALDVTNPDTLPGSTNGVKFLWEFSGDPASGNYLGYATSGPAVVRVGKPGQNGRWLAVFGSGPTGPIDATNHAFLGASSQNLKLFVVDVATGTLLTTIDTGLTEAFAGSLASNVIDTDRWNSQSAGFYSDDAIYIGYVQKDTSAGTWTKGGVLRLQTKEDTDPTKWAWSTVISGIGPVTTAVTKLQDRAARYDKSKSSAALGKLWLYFGSGRYFYKSDDLNNQDVIYGIEEPCYSNNTGSPNFTPVGPANDFDSSCTSTVSLGSLQNQSGDKTTAPASTLATDKRGWYINLDTSALNDGFSSERLVTNPVAAPSGAVFFTTFRPTADICGYGGNSNVWAVKYDSGAAPPVAAMQGKALIQVSTGALAEIALSSAFNNSDDLRLDKRRTYSAISGMPPSSSGLSLIGNPKPAKKVMHYQEK